jgi:hypothetical protein
MRGPYRQVATELSPSVMLTKGITRLAFAEPELTYLMVLMAPAVGSVVDMLAWPAD